jgi:hypothetical protein
VHRRRGWSLQAWPARTCASSHSTPGSRGADLHRSRVPHAGQDLVCSAAAVRGARKPHLTIIDAPRHCHTRDPLLSEWLPVSQCIPCEGRIGSCVRSRAAATAAAVLEMVLSVGGSAAGVRSGRCPQAGVRPSAGTRRDHLALRRDVSRETSPHRVGDTPDEAARAARHGHDPRCVGPRQAALAFEVTPAAVQQGDEVARPNRMEGLLGPVVRSKCSQGYGGCPAHVDEDSDRSGPAKRSEASRPVPDTGRPPPRGLARATLCP